MEDINIKAKILYVDDEENNLIVFKSSFRRNYDIFTAKSGAEGLDVIKEHDIDIIITDQRMPGMTGVEFLKSLPQEMMAIRMVLTGFSDVSAIIEAINSGNIYKYITKPWDKDELKITIDNALETLSLKKKNQSLIKELKAINENLEQKVELRTSELQNALNEIKDQKQKLEELNATKDKFFSIVAHDLRDPISSLGSFSHLLSEFGETMSPQEISKLSKELNKATKNAINLVDNLLTWAYSQMNRIEHRPEEININALIQDVLAQLSSTAEVKQITLSENLAPNLTIIADADQVKLVLRNLITNAIKFTHQGGNISVITQFNTSSSIKVIKIIDSGVGINAEKLENLFKIGSTKSTNGTAGEKGTGLGLILCKEFVEKNNGQIEVTSEENKGTTFILKFK